MDAIRSVARSTGLLSVCLFAFGVGFFIGQEHVPMDEPVIYPEWVDTVCLEGRAHWGQNAHRECHVVELPEKEQK